MAELVDALDSGSSRRKSVDVRLILVAMPIAIIANGSIHNYEAVYPLVRCCSQIIAVDGGLDHCHQLEIRPTLIIGDFDSVSPSLLRQYEDIPRRQYPTEKDETDLELAIRLTLETDDQIILFAITGKRLDHTVSNLFLLGIDPERLEAYNGEELLFAIDKKCELSTFPGQVISLLPLFGNAVVSTTGLKWNLNRKQLNHGFFSQSNRAVDEKTIIDVTEGMVLCALHSSVSSVRGSSS